MGIQTVSQALSNENGGFSPFGFKNRIINGARVIDQRNAGASVTVNNNTDLFAVDRWAANGQSADGVFTAQQSSTAPIGFVNSLVATVTTADSSIGVSQRYFIAQKIEGLNTSDLGWGTANAATVTLSFWVRSSLTGTFGGSIKNSDSTRSYPFTYTISSANTFEQKTITIAGDTSGTWLTTNGIGIVVGLSLGAGSSFLNTAGAWAAGNYFGATGQTNLIGTNGATFYITGVQLEKGSTATSFDYRPYGTEFALCQRYCYVGNVSLSGNCDSAGQPNVSGMFPVSFRTTPILNSYSGNWRGAMLAAISNLSITSFSGAVVNFYSTQSGTINTVVIATPGTTVNLSSEL